MPSLGLKLKEQCDKIGVPNTIKVFREGVKSGRMTREQFSIREMAQGFMGDAWDVKMHRFCAGGTNYRESTEAVDASQFAAITGQILIDKAIEKYQLATQIGDSLYTVDPITNGNLGEQTEPGLGRVTNDPLTVNQGMPYPTTGFGHYTRRYPAPQKYGEICNVTMEMIFSDRTGQVFESAESVGEMTGLWVEYLKLANFLGLTPNYTWNGTTYNPYLTSGLFVNKLTDFTLTDWRAMNRLSQLFVKMKDPATGKRIMVDATKNIFTLPQQEWNVARIINATTVREGDITTGLGTQTEGANPITRKPTLLTSAHADDVAVNGVSPLVAGGFTQAQADTLVIVGDFKRALTWRQVYPLKVVQAPPLAAAEYLQDIPLSIKSSVFGVAAWKEPRYVAMGYNASAS